MVEENITQGGYLKKNGFTAKLLANKAGVPVEEAQSWIDDKAAMKLENIRALKAANAIGTAERLSLGRLSEALSKKLTEQGGEVVFEEPKAIEAAVAAAGGDPVVQEHLAQVAGTDAAIQQKLAALSPEQRAELVAEGEAYARDLQATYSTAEAVVGGQAVPADKGVTEVDTKTPEGQQVLEEVVAGTVDKSATTSAQAAKTPVIVADANALSSFLKAAREAVTVEELTDDEKARRAKKAEPYSGERQAGARNRILNAPLSPSELSRREGMKDAGLTEGKIETIERGSVLLDDAQKVAYIAALGLDEEKLEAAIVSTKAGIAAKAKPAASTETKAEAETQGSYLKDLRQHTKAKDEEKKGRARESMRTIDTLLPEDAAKRIGVQLEVYKGWEGDKAPVPADKFEATQKAFGLEDGSKLVELSKALETTIADRKANIARIQASRTDGGKTLRG